MARTQMKTSSNETFKTGQGKCPYFGDNDFRLLYTDLSFLQTWKQDEYTLTNTDQRRRTFSKYKSNFCACTMATTKILLIEKLSFRFTEGQIINTQKCRRIVWSGQVRSGQSLDRSDRRRDMTGDSADSFAAFSAEGHHKQFLAGMAGTSTL